MRQILLTAISLLLGTALFAQQIDAEKSTGFGTGQDLEDEYNVITTAVSFLTITPDSRSGAMGDVGAATTTDTWAQHSNASKYALAKNDFGIGLSYTPWLSNLGIKDINLAYLAGYKKLSDKDAVGVSKLFCRICRKNGRRCCFPQLCQSRLWILWQTIRRMPHWLKLLKRNLLFRKLNSIIMKSDQIPSWKCFAGCLICTTQSFPWCSVIQRSR